MGRDLLQSFQPLNSVHEHVCAWHFYAHDMSRQVEVHHFCSHPSEEVRQCCLFDSDQKGKQAGEPCRPCRPGWTPPASMRCLATGLRSS